MGNNTIFGSGDYFPGFALHTHRQKEPQKSRQYEGLPDREGLQALANAKT
jgi:hypothetical protein